MKIGKVVGTIVATQKNEKLTGRKLLVVEDMDLKGLPTGNYLVAIDAIGAGEGEIVLTCGGSSARLTSQTEGCPVDGTIIAIIETVEVGGEVRYSSAGERAGG